MAYDYLSDPTGGQRVYNNPMLSWGMIGVDLGLTMGSGLLSKGMHRAEASYIGGMGRRLSDKAAADLGPKYAKFGKSLRGIGLFAAAAGIFDLGFSLMSEMNMPGVSREARDRDREILANNEGMLDTRMAYTQRQRAIQAVHDSQISIGRSMIGQESSYLHR